MTPAAKGAGGASLAVGAALVAAIWLHALLGFGGTTADELFARWIYDAVIFSTAFTLLWRGFTRPAGLPWLALGAGLLLHVIGDVMYSAAPDLDAVPVPSIYDPLWLAIYPCAYAALLILIRRRVGRTLLALRLDGVVSGLAAASLLASVSLPLALDASAGAPFWETATNLAYTVGDLVLFGAVVSAIALDGWRLDRMWTLLGGAVLAWEAADLMYLFGVKGTPGLLADALVATGALGMAAAGYADSGARGSRAPVAHGMLVPVGSGAVALGVLALGAPLQLNAAALALAAAALALALARMGLALRENDQLLGESRVEAATDALTGLPNRRSLKADLEAVLEDGRPHVLVLLDLNGFKSYNDAFGHAAGDTVLTRLGKALAQTVAGDGAAYRMGGDEFCVLAACPAEQADAFSARCAAGMTLRGQGFSITAAHGAVTIPGEQRSTAAALALADERMYQRKLGGRVPAAKQSANVLAAVAEEHAPGLAEHMRAVRELATATAVEVGVVGAELEALRYAAALHDIGKLAIPTDILDKPGPLAPDEWELVRQHTIVGERILASAPALDRSARLVRSSHERVDGSGYPDGLSADTIPLAARIIAVTNAYDAMLTERVYAPARSPHEALAELHRCAGTQFDPAVVAAFERALPRIGSQAAAGERDRATV